MADDPARADTDTPETDDALAPPPAPWTSWDQVWQVREALKDQRWLLLRRPEHLTPEQQATVDALISSPAGNLVGVARRFLLDWYALWRTEDGQRRPLAEAQERYERWRTDPAYQARPALQKVQDVIHPPALRGSASSYGRRSGRRRTMERNGRDGRSGIARPRTFGCGPRGPLPTLSA